MVGSMLANSDATPAGDNTASTYSNGYSEVLGLTGVTNDELVAQFQQLGIDTSTITDITGANIFGLANKYGDETASTVGSTDDEINQEVTDTGDAISDDVAQTGDEVTGSVQDSTNDAISTIDNADGAIHDASEENGDAWAEPMEEAGDEVQSAAGDAADGAVGEISSRDGDFNSSGVGNANEYTSGLDTAEGGSESAGDNATQGFLNSASNAGGSFWSRAGNSLRISLEVCLEDSTNIRLRRKQLGQRIWLLLALRIQLRVACMMLLFLVQRRAEHMLMLCKKLFSRRMILQMVCWITSRRLHRLLISRRFEQVIMRSIP